MGSAKFTRRSVASALLATGTSATFAQPGTKRLGNPPGLRIRRNLAELTGADLDLQALRRAIGRMRTDQGPLGWQTQRKVHAAPWGHHNGWRFLPWHRFQLYYLERIIARVSGKADFAMPYWDWNDDRAPRAFFEKTGSLFDETRTITPTSKISDYIGFDWKAGTNAGDFWSRTDNDFGDFFGSPNPTGEMGVGYAGSAEQYGHNLVHLFVGGRMRDLPESPLDPLFWAHHSNVDRQWAIWTEIHGSNLYPDAWGTEICTGYVDQDGYLASARKAADAIDTRSLGFTYDDLGLAERSRRPETWPGKPDAVARSTLEARLELQRQGVNRGRIFVPPELLAGLKGAQAPKIDAAGLMQVMGMDGYTVSLTSLSIHQDYEFARDAVFSVPMGGMSMGMHPLGHRLQLNRLVPRDLRALSEGFWISAEAKPLNGETSSSTPELVSFDLDFRVRTIL